MILFYLLGKHPNGELFLRILNARSRGKQKEISGKEQRFLRIGDNVLIATNKMNVIVDAETCLAKTLENNWKRSTGEALRDIMEENEIYDIDFNKIEDGKMTITPCLEKKIKDNWKNKGALIGLLINEARDQFHKKYDYEHNFEGTKIAKENGLADKTAYICFELGNSQTPEEFLKKVRKINL